jgi:hypothetical protein
MHMHPLLPEPEMAQDALDDILLVDAYRTPFRKAAMFFLEAGSMLLVRLSLNRQCWRMLLRK